nr:uncharacterized protein LOC127329148 [Lolium perenne]
MAARPGRPLLAPLPAPAAPPPGRPRLAPLRFPTAPPSPRSGHGRAAPAALASPRLWPRTPSPRPAPALAALASPRSPTAPPSPPPRHGAPPPATLAPPRSGQPRPASAVLAPSSAVLAPAPAVLAQPRPGCSSPEFSRIPARQITKRVFIEIPPRYYVPNSFGDMLNEDEVSTTELPLDAYELDSEDDGEEVEDGTAYNQDMVEEIDEEVFDAAKGKKKRVVNNIEIKDTCFVRVWSQVSIDAVHDTDQTGKRYWQRIEDKFFDLMPGVATPAYRSY